MSNHGSIRAIINADPALACLDAFGPAAHPSSPLQQTTTAHTKPTAGNIVMVYVPNAERSELLLCYAADHQSAKWFDALQILRTITVTVQYPDLEGFIEEVTQEMSHRGIEPTARFRERGKVNTCLYAFLEPRPELGKEVEVLMLHFQKRYNK